MSISLVLLITDTIDDVMSLTGVSSDKLFVKSEGIQLTHPLMVEISNSYSLDVSRNIPESITLTISPETDAYGNSEISITIINASGITSKESFMLTVVDAASRSISLDGTDDHVIIDTHSLEVPDNAISIESLIYMYTNTTDMAIVIANSALTITAGPTINIQWEQATDDQSLAADLEYAVVMSSYSQTCLETLGQIALNLMPCQIETLIPFQFVSGSGSGETVRSVSVNVAAVDISGLPSGTYYFNVLVRDEMNNLAGYDSTIVSF
jgi:hypothetical protein